MHFRKHFRGSQAVAREHDHRVEPQVSGLAHQCKTVARLRREHRLGRLLADLLQHRVLALGEELRNVGLGGVAILALVDGRGDALQRFVKAGLHFL